jgi:cysteine desulfurase
MNESRIFMDNAAGRAVDARVLDAMLPYFGAEYGNPSSLYAEGVKARRALDAAREEIAALLGAREDEIFFTSGGTESDNWALRCCAGDGTILTSHLEHPAIAETAKELAGKGRAVEFLPVTPEGRLNMEALGRRLSRGDCSLVTLQHANHETGVIQPVREAAELAHRCGALLLCDAVASASTLAIDVEELGVDLLSISGHKLGAVRGVGLLYIRRGTPCAPLLTGGGQENGLRSGTESVAAAVGLATAMRLCRQDRAKKNAHLYDMTTCLRAGVLSLPGVMVNSHSDPRLRLPGTLNVSFDCVGGGPLVLWLNRQGICVSAGSACSSAGTHPSPVLVAMGRDDETAMSAIRYSLSAQNTMEQVETVLRATVAGVKKLRSLDLRGATLYPEKG